MFRQSTPAAQADSRDRTRTTARCHDSAAPSSRPASRALASQTLFHCLDIANAVSKHCLTILEIAERTMVGKPLPLDETEAQWPARYRDFCRIPFRPTDETENCLLIESSIPADLAVFFLSGSHITFIHGSYSSAGISIGTFSCPDSIGKFWSM